MVSLFTNIPLTLVKKSIRKRWPVINQDTSIPPCEFVQGLSLICEYSSFKFQDVYYQQIFGTPMGAPLSPVLAELIMEYLEERCFRKINFDVPFFYLYVDDIITCVPSDKSDSILHIFNNFHSKMKFTIEIEDDTGISFLDTKIKIENQKIITNWYRKPTWSGRVLNFYSHHPLSQKIAIIFNMVDKALKLSDPQFFDQNITIIKNALKNNHYPSDFIDKYVKKRLDYLKHVDIKNSVEIDNPCKVYRITTPFINQIAPKLKQVSKKFNCDNYEFTTTFCNRNKTNIYFDKMKDKDEIGLKCNAIYNIPCKDCNKVYIGQTKRYIKKRVYEHKNDYKKSPFTALTKHQMDNFHRFDFENVKILATEKNLRKRITKK